VSDLDVTSFLRGNAWAGTDDDPYPRADPADFSRLPADTWEAARIPVGVRLELTGDADAIEIDYTTATDDLGYRGDQAGREFTVWQGDDKHESVTAQFGAGTARLPLGSSAGDLPWVVHVPEGMRPRLHALRPVGGTVAPAPAGPRWLAYGDSITEGWVASEPGMAWPSIVGRRHHLDFVNLGYAGSARGELATAEQIAALPPADVISIMYGTNCWSRIPDSVDSFVTRLQAFLTIVRQGHPDTPLLVVSPILRPDAETTPNRLGASLNDLRDVIESTALSLADQGVSMLSGNGHVTADQLPDGVHPDDNAQWTMADVVGSAVVKTLGGASR
jgi:lysophospholipase L1-like esterase